MSWEDALKEACKRNGQAATAKTLGLSPTTISQVLSGNYKAATDNIQRTVEANLMARTVECPVCGEIPLRDCIDHAKRPFTPVNPVWVKLAKACQNCPVPK